MANRDLKLENLLLCRNGDDPVRPLLKIGDFGAPPLVPLVPLGLLLSQCRPTAECSARLRALPCPPLTLSTASSHCRAAPRCHPPGYSKHDYNSSAHTRCGTQAYMAPEVLSCTGSYDAKVRLRVRVGMPQHKRHVQQGRMCAQLASAGSRTQARAPPCLFTDPLAPRPPPHPSSPDRAQKADVWSAGVILFTCLAGCFPWKPGDPGCVQRMVAAQVGGGQAWGGAGRWASRGMGVSPPPSLGRSRGRARLCARPTATARPPARPSRRCLMLHSHPCRPALQYEIPIGVEVSAPCRDLLSRMLTADPEARWGMDQVGGRAHAGRPLSSAAGSAVRAAAAAELAAARRAHPPPAARAHPQVMQHPWFLQDLPPGAQQMNAFYLGSTPRVDSAAPQVAAILQAAAAPGAAGEPPMACRFSAPPASPAGSGTGAAQARPATT